MDIKESERTVIAKPVASRPCSSSFRSFSELLAGAINATPSASNTTTSSEIAVHAIRPKTVRFKPMVHRSVSPLISSQGELSGDAMCDNQSDKALNSEVKSTVVYKPLAKLVSKTTVSLLATMGNFNQKSLQQTQTSTSSKPHHFHREKDTSRPRIPSRSEPSPRPIEPSKRALPVEDDTRSSPSMGSTDRPSYDGYNWRKYGQKQVKGSEYPRSYYKCTHPSCPVKKKVERSLDGKIAEIVYKGEHNHSKPQPAKRGSSGAPQNEVSEGRLDSHNEVGLSSSSTMHHSYRGVIKAASSQQPYNSSVAALSDGNRNNNGDSIGVSVEAEEGSKGIEAEGDEPRSTKRRKRDDRSNETGISRDATQDAKVVVQNSSDPEVSGDGFRWRKYGQKVVKGNPYPRSYYRCTSLKCNVRKHVERASDDPKAFITTYEGKHNHEVPIIRNPNSISSHTST